MVTGTEHHPRPAMSDDIQQSEGRGREWVERAVNGDRGGCGQNQRGPEATTLGKKTILLLALPCQAEEGEQRSCPVSSAPAGHPWQREHST
jgi:hypothetical protein